MITIPERDTPYRIMAIDNGSTKIGLSVMDLCLSTGKVRLLYSDTFLAHLTADRYSLYGEHANRFARMLAIMEFTRDEVTRWTPDVVCIESPFLNRRMPESFAVLREALILLKLAITNTNPAIIIEDISPREAKVAAKVDLKQKGKDPVKDAVLKLPIECALGIDLHNLQEDAIDSIAVGYCKVVEITNALKGISNEPTRSTKRNRR